MIFLVDSFLAIQAILKNYKNINTDVPYSGFFFIIFEVLKKTQARKIF